MFQVPDTVGSSLPDKQKNDPHPSHRPRPPPPLCICPGFQLSGEKVVLQTDLDTVIIQFKLNPVRKSLIYLQLEINKIRATILSNVTNNIKDTASADQLKKVTVSIVNVITETIRKEIFEIDQLSEVNETKQKRVLEILGDFLLTRTGVPSASDMDV